MQSAPRSPARRPAPTCSPFSSIDDRLAALDLAHELRADEVERARLRGDDPVVVDAAEHERAEAVRVAERDELALGERDDRVRALELLHRVRDRIEERRLVVRDQRGDHLAVGRRAHRDARLAQLVAQRRRIDEVAVVAERDRAHPAVLHERLRVRPLRRSRRRVARVPDRDLPAQSVQLLLVEHLRDEAEVAQRRQAALLRDGDPRRLLAAVLQREEAEIREPRDVALRRVHAEDAAHGYAPGRSRRSRACRAARARRARSRAPRRRAAAPRAARRPPRGRSSARPGEACSRPP